MGKGRERGEGNENEKFVLNRNKGRVAERGKGRGDAREKGGLMREGREMEMAWRGCRKGRK